MSGLNPSTSNGVLVDTNVVINQFRAENLAIKNHLRSGGVIFLPLTVMGELYAGAFHVVRRDKALQQIRGFSSFSTLLLPGENTALRFGEIHAELAAAGTPIPQNDIWIAAFAREHSLPLVTYDAHFTKVSGLTILNWR